MTTDHTTDIGGGWAMGSTSGNYLHAGQPHTLAQALKARMFRDVRKARGLTQEQVARQIVTTVTTISRWERGDKTPAAGLYRDALERYLRDF